eukprot:8030001-Alexandrium_andersonii.AAC.1
MGLAERGESHRGVMDGWSRGRPAGRCRVLSNSRPIWDWRNGGVFSGDVRRGAARIGWIRMGGAEVES